MSLIDLVVRRPVATWMIAIALGVFGLVSYQRLPLTLMPDLAYPAVTVRTQIAGYAPEEVEIQVSRPVEEALATTPGLVELESRSRAGSSDVVLQFTWGTQMDAATQTIRESLQTTFLPKDADRPLILRYDPSQEPILRLGLSDDLGREARLREVAERELKRELEAMDGIAAVRVRGGLEREIVIALREDWLAARQVTIDQVVATLGAENVNVPGGLVRDGDNEYLVRTLNEVRRVDEIAALEVRRTDGTRVPLSEVGTIRETHKDREVISHLDGEEAVELEVYKAADANIVRVAQQVKRRLGLTPRMPGLPPDPAARSRLPDGMHLVVLDDQARFIEASIDNLRSTALLGALLAVGVLFLFLRSFRATAIIGAAIPLSIAWTFAPMYIGGVSLNLMSLGGLALGVGMLVDNAVVVLENIQVHLDRGVERKRAAVLGTQEVAAAVTASTLTTVSVFLPIAFVEGIAGQVFGDLSLAVVFSLLASLIVALFFVPMFAAIELHLPSGAARLRDASPATRFRSLGIFRGGWRGRAGWRRLAWLPLGLSRLLVRLGFELLAAVVVFPSAWVARLGAGLGRVVIPRLAAMAMWAADRFHSVYDRFDARYRARLGPILGRPGLVLGGAALAVLLTLVLGASLGQSLIPELHQGRFTAEIALPVGTPLSRTAAVATDAERALVGAPGIVHVHSITGTEQRADSRPDEGEHTARLMVEVDAGGGLSGLEAREDAAITRVRAALEAAAQAAGVSRLDLRVTRPSLFSVATPVELRLYDNDLSRLREISTQVRDRLARIDGLRDVRSSMVAGYPEVRVFYDRALLARMGLDTAGVARQLREKIQGERASSVVRGDGRLDMVVRLDEGDRRGVDDLRRINVNPAINPPVPLEMVARLQMAEGPSEIRRVDQRRAVSITANVDGFDISGQAQAIRDAMAGLHLGVEGVDWELAGQDREMERSLRSLQMALLLAVFLVYVIMASTFESVLHPLVILFSVPLAVVGVTLTLWVTGFPVSVVVLIGAIVLAGVVVNNAIVLVDTINRLRAKGLGRVDAIQQGAALRLRPILITTFTTVLGLFPLALGLGEGAEVQQPLAVTVIAGLLSSTLLTLVVIPVVYAVLTGWIERRGTAGAP